MCMLEMVDSMCRDSVDTQYMIKSQNGKLVNLYDNLLFIFECFMTYNTSTCSTSSTKNHRASSSSSSSSRSAKSIETR